MPGLEAHEQVARLLAGVYELIRRVESQATSEEVRLRVEVLRQELDELGETIGAGASGPFGTLGRHLYFLNYWYERNRPESYAPDIVDMTERDLPGVVAAVSEWARSGLDAGLAASVTTSWGSRHYAGAVRDAFIYLESVLRELGGVDPSRGLSGERLIEELLGPNSASALTLPPNGLFGVLTGGERAGAYHLFRGAFLLVRNSTAHRSLDYTRREAEDLIRLVNVCLGVLRGSKPPDQV